MDDQNILRIGFGDPADNDVIVRDASEILNGLRSTGQLSRGEIIRVHGPASLPVAMAIGHSLSHLYQAVACFDPKLSKYVVAVSHGRKYSVGDLLD